MLCTWLKKDKCNIWHLNSIVIFLELVQYPMCRIVLKYCSRTKPRLPIQSLVENHNISDSKQHGTN